MDLIAFGSIIGSMKGGRAREQDEDEDVSDNILERLHKNSTKSTKKVSKKILASSSATQSDNLFSDRKTGKSQQPLDPNDSMMTGTDIERLPSDKDESSGDEIVRGAGHDDDEADQSSDFSRFQECLINKGLASSSQK